MQTTLLKEFFATMAGWILLFTVPYWASSQPIEQVWAFVKNYVALRWFPGRTTRQLRSQILCGMYGRARAGEIAECWTEVRGLRRSGGLTADIAVFGEDFCSGDGDVYAINGRLSRTDMSTRLIWHE